MFFVRDKNKISIFAAGEREICTPPNKVNEDFVTSSSDEQSTQSTKLKELNIDRENREKYAQLEKNLENTSRMLADYGKQPHPSNFEEQKEPNKKAMKDTEDVELGQINEKETESGDIERNQSKSDLHSKPPRPQFEEEHKHEERYESSSNFNENSTKEEAKVQKSFDKKENSRRDVKIVSYNLDSQLSDEAGGNRQESNDEKIENTQNEYLNNTDEADATDFINKVRSSPASKNLMDSDYQRSQMEKLKKRRNRSERETHGSTIPETDEKQEDVEESKEEQPKSFINNQMKMFEMLNRGKQVMQKITPFEQTYEPQEEKQRSSVSAVEDVKHNVEEAKAEHSNQQPQEEAAEIPVNDESKQEELQQDHVARQAQKQKISPKGRHSEPGQKKESKLEKHRQSESSKNAETYECNMCKTRNPARSNKFEKSVEELVVASLREQLPELLSETVKQNVAASIVKQTKTEMAGIHSSNFKRIEQTVMTFAETKIDESKRAVEDKVKDHLGKIVADEFKKIFMDTVMPH